MNNNIRIAFFGTPELTTTILDELLANNLAPIVIITGEDKKQGRKMILTPSPAKVWALVHTIPFLQPAKLDSKWLEEFKKYNIDLSVVVAYGKILPEAIINIPRLGTINIHYSLLPKFRGATPVESAILAGEKETGVVIQKMRYKLDSGPIIKMEKTVIDEGEKAVGLRARLNDIGKKLLVEAITDLANGKANLTEQNDSEATQCGKIKKEDGEIRLSDDPLVNWRKFRAYYGWPNTYFFTEKRGKRTRVIIKDATFMDGIFTPTRVIPEGGKEIAYADFLRN